MPVDGHRGLADTALAAGDREHLGQRAGLGERDLALGLAAAQGLLEVGALLGGHHAELEVDRGDAFDGGHGRRDVAVDGVLEGAAGHREQHLDRHPAVVGDVDGLDHVELGDGALDLGVVDRGERGVDLLEGGAAHDPQAYVVPAGRTPSASWPSSPPDRAWSRP
jgi:hypothetical protein